MNQVGKPQPKQPRHKDNAALYEALGDIVIGLAHAGDDHCIQIYQRAWTKANKDELD